MSLTRLFVERPTLVTVFLALVLLAGAIAGSTLVQQQFPNADVPSIQVLVSYPGASTTEMRDAIVRPLEDQLSGSPDLDHLETSIQPGQASIVAVFALTSNQNNDLVQVQGRVQNAQRSLPNDVTTPQIAIYNPSQAVVVSLVLRSRALSVGDLSSLTINKIVPQLDQVSGVSFVQENGTVTPSIQVNVDPRRLTASGFTLTDVISTITANNVRSPGGILYSPNRETNLDVRGDIQNVATVAGLLLSSGAAPAATTNPWTTQPRLLRIGDVANVRDTFETQRVYAYSNGEPCVTLDIQKSAGTSEVDTSRNVLAALPALRRTYPDVQFGVLNVQSTYTEQQLTGVVRTLVEAIVFTGIVMLLFLRSWRNALVVMIAIPASLLVTLGAMKLAHFTLDTVSLLAMTLIIGILVDDSIVVLENVERHFEGGEEPKTAAITGRSEIGVAAIVITLVDVVVFLPISFLPGSVGLFMREFGLVVTVATLTSLFVSFTVTPALAGRWALLSRWRPWKIIDAFTARFEALRETYVTRLLTWGLEHDRTVAVVSALSLVLALALIPLGLVGFEYIPPVDRGELYLTVTYPSGTPLETTRRGILAIEGIVDGIDDLRSESSTAGAYLGQLSGYINNPAIGQIDVYLKDGRGHSTAYWVAQLQAQAQRVVPRGAKVVAVPATDIAGGNAQPIDEVISSVDGHPEPYAAKVAAALAATPGAIDVTTSGVADAPQVAVEFNRERARALDASIGTASTAIRAAFAGDLATQFTGQDGLKNVLVTYPQTAQTSLGAIEAIPIRAANGSIVRVGDIAHLVASPAPPMIVRINRQSVVYAGADLAPGATLSNVQRDFAHRLAALQLPSSVTVAAAAGGNEQQVDATVRGMTVALLLSIVLVYLLMVALYNSYRTPFIIMFAVPVAVVGALGSLALTGQTLNLFSLIGSVLLIGLVTKNGILLVDFANRRRAAGLDRFAAIHEAARERFRPIIMTTAAMVAGMLPLALALDPGAQAERSLGTVVIGGLASSLLLTLVLVPIVYVALTPRNEPVHNVPLNPDPTVTLSPTPMSS
jgi:HAE1 family hydrophobic/amphiphilic exporter-1